MTAINDVHAVADWLEREVCPKIELKVPAKKEQTDKYDYKLTHPSVSRMFSTVFSNKDYANTAPGILVQFMSGDDMPLKGSRDVRFRLILTVWSTGTHAGDYIDKDDQTPSFESNDEGWNDAFNFMDLVLRELKNTEYIGDSLRVKTEDGFKFGPYKEGATVLEFYPYYVCEIEFSCESAQAPPIKPYVEDLL